MISKQQLEQIIIEEVQAVLGEKKKCKKKKKTKVSKAGQKRVSKKIGILISKEKMDPKQAAAVAYSMEKSGKLTKHGQYKKSKKKKLEEAAKDYVWGVKGIHRIGNKFGGWVPIKRKISKKKKS
tara:strand:- start:5 stop:376 length:372 start_codon:yes stop_codon:yes gene_type:complete